MAKRPQDYYAPEELSVLYTARDDSHDDEAYERLRDELAAPVPVPLSPEAKVRQEVQAILSTSPLVRGMTLEDKITYLLTNYGPDEPQLYRIAAQRIVALIEMEAR